MKFAKPITFFGFALLLAAQPARADDHLNGCVFVAGAAAAGVWYSQSVNKKLFSLKSQGITYAAACGAGAAVAEYATSPAHAAGLPDEALLQQNANQEPDEVQNESGGD